jgi:hypothetical protein
MEGREERYRDSSKRKVNRVDKEGRRKIPEVEKWGGMRKKVGRGKMEYEREKGGRGTRAESWVTRT